MKKDGMLKRLRTYTGMMSVFVLHLGFLQLIFKDGSFKNRSSCTPGFACHGCPWSAFACPIGVMAHGSAARSLPLLAIATVLGVGLALGRLVCGFFCPFGWLQDLLHKIPSPKFTLPKFTRYIKYAALVLLVFAFPYFLGYEVGGFVKVEGKPVPNKNGSALAVSVKLKNISQKPVKGIDLKVSFVKTAEDKTETVVHSEEKSFPELEIKPYETVPVPDFEVENHISGNEMKVECAQSAVNAEPKYDLYYCKVCPVGTLTAHLPRYFVTKNTEDNTEAIQQTPPDEGIYGMAKDNWLRISILVFFLIMMVFVSRVFCRIFCPLGAIYGLCSRFALTRVEIDPDNCVGCGLCDKACPVGLDVRKEVGGPECIACGDCMKVCPKGSITRRFGP